MNTLINKKVAFMALLAVGLFATFALAAPNSVDALPIDTIDPLPSGDCSNPPTVATFNPYPRTYSGETCKDYPLIDAKLMGGSFSQNNADYNNGLTAKAGDEILVRVYVHNGAATNLSQAQTTARNVNVHLTTDTSVGSSHQLTARANADNAATLTSNFTIHTASNERLEIVSGSATVFDRELRKLRENFTAGNGSVALGNQLACYDHLRWITFKVRVVAPAPTSTATTTPSNTPVATGQSPSSIVCTLNQAQHGTIYRLNNDNKWLVSNAWLDQFRSQGAHQWQKPLSGVNIPAGDYTATIQTWDNHSAHGGQGQRAETVSVLFRSGNSATDHVGAAGVSQDIPEHADYWNTTVPFTLDRAAGNLYAIHGAPNDTSSPNSVLAVCIGLKPVTTPTPTPTATPTPTPTPTETPTPLPDLEIRKSALNLSLPSGDPERRWDGDEITAQPGHRILFGMQVENTGDADATNVFIRDVLPGRMTFISGSVEVDGASRGDAIVTSQGMSLGRLTPGQIAIIYLQAHVNDAHEFSVGTTRLTNNVFTRANGIAEIGDDVDVLVTVEDTGTPELEIQKRVRNVSDGTNLAESVNADFGEIIAFELVVMNNGNRTATDVRVTDILPSQLTYLSGAPGITTNGVFLGDLVAGASRTLVFEARVGDENLFPAGVTTTMTNVGSVTASNTPSDSDTATVRVFRDQTTNLSCYASPSRIDRGQSTTFFAQDGTGSYTWSVPQAESIYRTGSGSIHTARFGNQTGTFVANVWSGNDHAQCTVVIDDNRTADVSIDKRVRNISVISSDSDYFLQNLVTARRGETVQFQFDVRNNGNETAFNVRVQDTLPNGLTYVPNSMFINGVFRADETSFNNITNNDVSLGTLVAGQTVRITFNARVDSNATTRQVTNTGLVFSNNAGTDTDTAFVNIESGTTVIDRDLSIVKRGNNVSRSSLAEQVSLEARPGDTLRFILYIRNTGNQVAHNVIVRDPMPFGVSYIPGSTDVNGNVVADGIATVGINVGSLAPGQEVRVRLHGQVQSAGTFSNDTTSLLNRAYTRADNISEREAQLSILVRKGSILGMVGQIPTGNGINVLILGMLGAALMTSMYAGYTRTNIFKKRDAQAIVDQHRSDTNRFNFA